MNVLQSVRKGVPLHPMLILPPASNDNHHHCQNRPLPFNYLSVLYVLSDLQQWLGSSRVFQSPMSSCFLPLESGCSFQQVESHSLPRNWENMKMKDTRPPSLFSVSWPIWNDFTRLQCMVVLGIRLARLGGAEVG